MKIIVSISLFIAVCTSCSTKDVAFCDCMAAGEELNDFAQKLMDREATKEEAVKLRALRSKKDTTCKAYETMDGPTMIEKKKTCEE